MTYRCAGTHRRPHSTLPVSYECKFVVQRDLGEIVFSAEVSVEGFSPRTLTGTAPFDAGQDPQDALRVELCRRLDSAFP